VLSLWSGVECRSSYRSCGAIETTSADEEVELWRTILLRCRHLCILPAWGSLFLRHSLPHVQYRFHRFAEGQCVRHSREEWTGRRSPGVRACVRLRVEVIAEQTESRWANLLAQTLLSAPPRETRALRLRKSSFLEQSDDSNGKSVGYRLT
jgi:hypothetical protein